jgi:hypothetical protein
MGDVPTNIILLSILIVVGLIQTVSLFILVLEHTGGDGPSERGG